MALTVLVAPLHAPSARENPRGVLPQVRKHDADIALLTEAYPRALRDQLSHSREYRYVVEQGGKDKVRGQYDVPVLVRSELRSLGSGQVFGCAASVPRRIAPERWMTYAAQQTDYGGVCVINLHPHAGVQGPDGGFNRSHRTIGFRNQMRRLDTLLTFAEDMGWLVVAGGDVNFRDTGRAPLSPYTVFREHGLDVHSDGIIAVAWSPRLGFDVTTVKVPQGISDHIWLKAVAR